MDDGGGGEKSGEAQRNVKTFEFCISNLVKGADSRKIENLIT